MNGDDEDLKNLRWKNRRFFVTLQKVLPVFLLKFCFTVLLNVCRKKKSQTVFCCHLKKEVGVDGWVIQLSLDSTEEVLELSDYLFRFKSYNYRVF